MVWKIRVILVVAVLIALATMSAPTHAAVNPFKGSGFQLDESDLALLETAAGKLYLTDGVEIGAVEEWNNPKTGNHGTVRLIGKPEYKGLPCRLLRHDIKLKSINDPYRFTLERCRTNDGEWKILAR
jgi:hypothetical protein